MAPWLWVVLGTLAGSVVLSALLAVLVVARRISAEMLEPE
jgi:hypothetical protein